MTDRPRILVVGGGIAGLVVARRLVLGGRDVTIFEAGGRLGGTVARHVVGGIELDAGAESFATGGGTVATLAKSLRLGDDIVEPNPDGAWLESADGSAHRLPKNSLLGIPGVPLASDVTAIIGARAGWRAFAELFIPGTVGAKSVTLGELVRTRMGAAVLDQLVRPIVRGVHSADTDNLKLDDVAPGLRATLARTGSLAHAVMDLRASSARAGSAVAGIRGGIYRLVDELRADLERFGVDIRLNSRVIEVAPAGVRIGAERLAGIPIVAAPALVPPSADRGHRVVLVTLVVDQPLLDAAPRGTGVLVADGAVGIRARALTHATAKWPWLAERAEGKHVLRLSYDADSPDLAEVARADAASLLGVPIDPKQVVDFASVEWYRPNRVTHTPNGIHVVGESIAGTGLASVIAQSEALAVSLLEDAKG